MSSAPALVVALDLASLEENLALVRMISSYRKQSHSIIDIWLKIGLRAFIRDGKHGIQALQDIDDMPLFLDLKLYDIPNTMADAAQECAHLGIQMITIHASSGLEGMRAVMQRLAQIHSSMRVLAVSALTSFDDEGFFPIYQKPLHDAVLAFSHLAQKANVHGMVCSVKEASAIKQQYSNTLILAPALRPTTALIDDQKRVATIEQALSAKVDFLVIGRPIYRASNVERALESILAEMHSYINKHNYAHPTH